MLVLAVCGTSIMRSTPHDLPLDLVGYVLVSFRMHHAVVIQDAAVWQLQQMPSQLIYCRLAAAVSDKNKVVFCL